MADGIQSDDRRLQKLRGLTEVSRALTYAVSLDEVLNLAVERAAGLLDADKAVLMLAGDDGTLTVRASHGIDVETCGRFREPLDETLIRRLKGLFGEATATSFLGVPLVAGGLVIGILAVARPEGLDDLDEDEWLLSALADQAAVALEKTRLDEAGAFRERLIGIVGHDLRNPLGAITMASGILLLRDSLGEQDTRLVRKIATSAARMSEMITQLLDFTRSRLGGGIPISPAPADLGQICRQVLDELELAHPQCALRFDPHGDLGGTWDRDRLAQVISNLVGNAIQHGQAGTPVMVSAIVDGDGVVLAVHNEGAPIPADLLPHLFDPFRRGSADPKQSSDGLGLGLYIAQQITIAHGGEITARSALGEGTTFTVRLPRAR